MKAKITNKEVRSMYDNVLLCNNANLENLLASRFPARFYNCGTYGWNYDVYSFGDTCIIVGYRNFPKCQQLNGEESKQIFDLVENMDADATFKFLSNLK